MAERPEGAAPSSCPGSLQSALSGLSSWSSCLSIVPVIGHDLNSGHVYHLIAPSQEPGTVPTWAWGTAMNE